MAVKKTTPKKAAAKKPTAKKAAAKPKAPSKPGAVKKAADAARQKLTPIASKILSNDPNAKLHPNADDLANLIETLGDLMQSFMNTADIHENLTPKERSRLIGAGVRNYGFIEKTLDIALDNQSFLPPNFNVQAFSNNVYEFDQIRQFYFIAEKLQTLASDSMLLKSTVLYKEAIRVYSSLREQAKAGVPGARDLFKALETFFKKSKNPESPPTEIQTERKIRSLIRGKTEGEIIIKNIKPKLTGGIHEVEEVQLKDDIKYKETAQGEIKE